jgi:hypothetical protein
MENGRLDGMAKGETQTLDRAERLQKAFPDQAMPCRLRYFQSAA